ncbi:hypothetical protein PSA7680_01976 [Pseudoruegeria aquimaris]|uniref:Uncharacterized protein n=1 Tax=Pseudoruegeria aquimaris TaxID=393663 RepID=A0A1Y5SHN2_9RHOB|nr:hypothetical protein [Pseudoruegeria aquimaris]SLN39876.1 hypothetical protein PSA7680_01976 [Pseudoruegeria aquimaris]
MPQTLDHLSRAARRLQKSHAAGDSDALRRLRLHPPRRDAGALKLADYLHVIAPENGFESWPKLKFAAEPEMAAFLATWAEDHPERVSEGGIV